MAANVLTGRVQITAPGAVQLFDNLGKGLTKLQQQVTAFGGGVQKFNSSFSGLANPINQANTGLNNLTKTSSTATSAMINLGRVVQDAPFGFLGIANNLNPLLESFQRLKAQTGSTGSALKALGSSLMGAGGIGLGLSVVSSLLIVFGDKLFGAGNSAERAKKAVDDLTKSFNDQKKAIDSLVDVFDDYSQIDAEILKGRGASSKQIFDTEIKYERDNVRLKTELRTKLNTELAQLQQNQAAFDNISRTQEGRSLIREESKINKERISEYKKNLQELSNEIDKDERGIVLKRVQFINEQAEESKRAGEKYINDTIAWGKKLADAFKDIAVVPSFTIFDSVAEQFKKASSVINQFQTATFKIRVTPEISLDPPKEDKTTGGLEFGQMFSKELNDYFKGPFTTDFSLLEAMKPVVLTDMQKLATQISDSLSNLAGDSLSSIAEGIGDVLGGGDLQNAFQGFARVIGQGFIAIGRQMVAAAPIIAALKAALKTLNPAVLLPAGLGLIAIGAALNSAVGRGIGRRARGGPVSGGLGYIVGEEGPELFRPNTGGTIVPNNALSGGGVMQGGMVVNVTGEFLQRGQDLLAVITLANQSKLRLQ